MNNPFGKYLDKGFLFLVCSNENKERAMPPAVATERKSIQSLAFEHYLRTGEHLTPGEWLARCERKFNPYHDPANGRFTSAPGGAALARKRKSGEVGRKISAENQKKNVDKIKYDLANKKINAFLDLTAQLESGMKYNIVTGGGTFRSYTDHPNIRV